MKKVFLAILLLYPIMTMAQLTFELKGEVNKKISGALPEGTKVVLTSVILNEFQSETVAWIRYDDRRAPIKYGDLKNISFSPENSKHFWQHQALKYEVYDNIIKNGLQFDLRKELEGEALDYLGYLESNDLIFNDDYLESYLHSLAFRVFPGSLEDGRPGILNIKILKDSSPNAFVFPNGTIILSSGLLSTINSEEELIGILAHEISHFVLDHSVININLEAQRQRRAEFWAAFATTLAAAADIYTASNNPYYTAGNLTTNTAILAYNIAQSAIERLGLEYSKQQELVADFCAKELLKFQNIDSTALSSALEKIKEYAILGGNYSILSDKGTHPNIDNRIVAMGRPSKNYFDFGYDRRISFINSYNAILAFNNKHFEKAENLIKRNIEANVATEEDYILLATVTMSMFDTELKNQEAFNLLQKAKTINVYPSINLPKQEAIALIRLGRLGEAEKSLQEYREELKKQWSEVNQILDPVQNTAIRNYLFDEDEWAAKMIHKVRLL